MEESLTVVKFLRYLNYVWLWTLKTWVFLFLSWHCVTFAVQSITFHDFFLGYFLPAAYMVKTHLTWIRIRVQKKRNVWKIRDSKPSQLSRVNWYEKLVCLLSNSALIINSSVMLACDRVRSIQCFIIFPILSFSMQNSLDYN